MTIQFPTVIAFNIPEFKPACVNLQRFYGGTPSLAMLFEPDPLTSQKQLDSLIKRSEEKHVSKVRGKHH